MTISTILSCKHLGFFLFILMTCSNRINLRCVLDFCQTWLFLPWKRRVERCQIEKKITNFISFLCFSRISKTGCDYLGPFSLDWHYWKCNQFKMRRHAARGGPWVSFWEREFENIKNLFTFLSFFFIKCPNILLKLQFSLILGKKILVLFLDPSLHAAAAAFGKKVQLMCLRCARTTAWRIQFRQPVGASRAWGCLPHFFQAHKSTTNLKMQKNWPVAGCA